MSGGREWTNDDLATLRRRMAEGVRHADIAAELGRSLVAVKSRAKKISADRSKTVSRPKPERTFEAKRRPCLMCRQEFQSEWPGHRVCGGCKQTEAWASGEAVHVGGVL
jgi:hypothetical protein